MPYAPFSEFCVSCQDRLHAPPRATALENAVAYVRFTIYDVRFIKSVRVARIFPDYLTSLKVWIARLNATDDRKSCGHEKRGVK